MMRVQHATKQSVVTVKNLFHFLWQDQTEKLIWLENFEQNLTETYIKWSGIIIIAGDFNIDILD